MLIDYYNKYFKLYMFVVVILFFVFPACYIILLQSFQFYFLPMIVITSVLGQVLAANFCPRTIFGCKTLS